MEQNPENAQFQSGGYAPYSPDFGGFNNKPAEPIVQPQYDINEQPAFGNDFDEKNLLIILLEEALSLKHMVFLYPNWLLQAYSFAYHLYQQLMTILPDLNFQEDHFSFHF